MTPIDLIIFDLDGTLIDSRKDIANCVNWTLEEMGLPAIDHRLIYAYVGHGVRTLMEGAVREAHGSDGFDRALELFDKYYMDHLLDHTVLFKGMAEVLEHFEAKDMAVITNKPQRYTDPIISGLGLDQSFGAVLGREACSNPKPHPDPVLKVLSSLPNAKERTIIIGDTEVDIEAGKQAGILTCGVLFGFGEAESVRQAEPDYLIDDVSVLTELFE